MSLAPLRARFWREQYEPTWLGLFINPFWFARRGLLNELRRHFPALTGELLDVGCGNKPYRVLVPAARYTGLDIDNAFTRRVAVADVFYDGGAFPLPDASFDAVLCSQVLEHVFTPEKFLGEIHRVLRPGGTLLLAVPFLWDEHEQPHDFGRYSSFGLRALLERNGFAVIEQRKSMADFGAVAQLASAWLFKVVQTRSKWLNLATQLLLIAPINILGALLRLVSPRSEDFYLDNVVLARKR
ncbi:MAG: class I SAM-dependent methyltransferase [Opitutaceae bacterium]|nr:class I SAM-dependent methyltransferase [Opitutaceae bacterium]